MANVTKHLQSLVTEDGIDIKVDYKTMGTDPSPGDPKELTVSYLVDGELDTKKIQDGSTFAVYIKGANTKPTVSDTVSSAAGGMYKSLISGLGTFLHLAGVGITYKVGTTLFDETVAYALTGIAFMIPFFGLWAMPLIVFGYRLFTSTDLPGLIQNGTTAVQQAVAQ